MSALHSPFVRVVLKDWYLSRWFTFGSVVLGAVALGLASIGPPGLYPAMILIIIAVIAQGIFLCMYGIVTERKERAALFSLTLPISTMQYSAAKALALVTAYLFPWVLLAAAALALLPRLSLPAGILPVAVVSWLFFLDIFCLLLGVALATESEGWTVATLVVTNTSISFWFYYIGSVPSLSATVRGPVAVWNAAVIRLLIAELVALVLIAALTFARIARKKDFL